MKNRSLQVRMVKDTPTDGEPTSTIDPDHINDLIKVRVEHVALTIGAVLLAKKAADTLSELILIAGRKYI